MNIGKRCQEKAERTFNRFGHKPLYNPRTPSSRFHAQIDTDYSYVDRLDDHYLSSGRAASIAIILGGSIYYTWVKHVESQKPTSTSEKVYERVSTKDLEAGEADQMREKPE